MTSLTGTRKLIRLILRRDRWIMPLWIVIFPLLMVTYATSFKDLFPTEAARAQYATASATNAGFVALYGRLFGSSLGELVTWRAGFLPVVLGLVGLLTVIRHTRTEEEAGRRELIESTVVGRHAALAAALIATLCANLVMAALVAGAMIGQGLPAAGSVAAGLEFAAAGWVFAAVGAVAAQITEGAGAARGLALSALGLAYVLRVAGDLSAIGNGALSWLTWLSPIAWAQKIQPYAGDRLWLLPPVVALTAVLAAVAVSLSARRDVGAGLLPSRLGPAEAAAGLRSPLALAWRLHRGLLAAWAAGFAVLGVVLGDLVGDNQQLADVFARIGGRSGLIDAYLATVMSLLGLIAAAYAIQATLRLRVEEGEGRAEPVLATAVGRLRWAGSHLVFSILGPTVVLAVAGLTAGLTHGLNTGDVGGQVPRVFGAALVQLPAVWVMAALAVALFGLLPRLAVASWGAYAACVLLGLVGAALQFSQWVMDVSPFTHIPRAPGGEVSATPLALLLAVALVIGAAGLAGLRRRDIPVT